MFGLLYSKKAFSTSAIVWKIILAAYWAGICYSDAVTSTFLCGIEHEIAFLREDGSFADCTNTTFEEFDAIIQKLPVYETDYPLLRVGHLGVRKKRWYIEGIQRFDESGTYVRTVPKGIEIRTAPHSSIKAAVTEVQESMLTLREALVGTGFRPVWLSHHPFRDRFDPDPPLNAWETAYRRSYSPETLVEEMTLTTFGPDVSLSFADWDDERVIDAGKKLTFYSSVIVPFSFSSPFFVGALWRGPSVRTALRTGRRPATKVFVSGPGSLIASSPSLTQEARVPAEVGRIEFKAFDTARDLGSYASFLALLKGLVLDTTLPGRALVPDAFAHQHAAEHAFHDDQIVREAGVVLVAARAALGDDPDAAFLAPLDDLLAQRATPADEMISVYHQVTSIEKALQALTY